MTGDINADGFLTPGDALCAFEIQLNGQEATPDCNFDGDCEVFTADVNCDGVVTAGDADAIFQRYLNDLPPEDCFNRDSEQVQIQEILLAGVRQQGEDSVFEVGVSAHSSAPYGCFGLEISYPPNILQFTHFEPLEGTSDWVGLEARTLSLGTVLVTGFAGNEAKYTSPGQFPLVKLQFIILHQPDEDSAIEVLHLYDSANNAVVLGSPMPLVDQVSTQLSLHFQNPTASSPYHIQYSLPSEYSGKVEINVYDVSGRLVASLFDARAQRGAQSLIWDGMDLSGNTMSAGIYFVRLKAGSHLVSKKLVVIK